MDLWIVFLTGLTLGGISCSLIQIGLFSSGISKKHPAQKMVWNVGSFLLTRIIVAMLIGLGLGFLGTSFLLPDGMKLTFQLMAGVIMMVTALSFTPFRFPSIISLSFFWD